jgi:flagellar protein FliT
VDPALEDYEFLSSVMGQMRAAAAEGEWDRLVALEEKCRQRVAAMKSRDAAPPPDEGAQQQKVALIHKILADDAEIRDLAQPWMAQLQRVLQSARQERRLLDTYSGIY